MGRLGALAVAGVWSRASPSGPDHGDGWVSLTGCVAVAKVPAAATRFPKLMDPLSTGEGGVGGVGGVGGGLIFLAASAAAASALRDMRTVRLPSCWRRAWFSARRRAVWTAFVGRPPFDGVRGAGVEEEPAPAPAPATVPDAMSVDPGDAAPGLVARLWGDLGVPSSPADPCAPAPRAGVVGIRTREGPW